MVSLVTEEDESETGTGVRTLLFDLDMKPRVKINGRSPYGEWVPGDTGVVDGYCRGGNNVPYAVVILDKNFRFVMVNLEQLEQIG